MIALAASRRHFLRRAAAACAAATLLPARARSSVEITVPYPAGGFTDILTRSLSDEVGRRLGEPVIVANRPGANSVLAMRQVIEHGAADGSSIILGSLGYLTTQWQRAGAPFDRSALSPIVFAGSTPVVLYIRADIPATTAREFVAWAKTQPSVSFGTSGPASSPHLSAENFCGVTGVKMLHVPFAGSPATLAALAGGHIDAAFDSVASRTMLATGRVRALMQGDRDPLPQWPELPTPAQAGLPGTGFSSWFGYFVPARTPAAVQDRLNGEFNAAMRSPAVHARLQQLCLVHGGGSRAEFASFLVAENERLGQLIHSRHIVLD